MARRIGRTALALGALALCVTYLATADRALGKPAWTFRASEFLVASEAAARYPDSGLPTSELAKAEIFYRHLRHSIGDAKVTHLYALDEALELPASTSEEKKARKLQVRDIRKTVRALSVFDGRLSSLRSRSMSAMDSPNVAALIKAVSRVARDATQEHSLSHAESHAAWGHLVAALDDTVALLDHAIDAEERRLDNTTGAAKTKAGRKALAIVALVGVVSDKALEHRTRIALLDDETLAVPVTGKATKAEAKTVRGLKTAVGGWASYAKTLEKLFRKLTKQVDRAIETAEEEPPQDDCPPTWSFQPDSGGGYIEVSVSGGGTRRYPAVASVNLEGSGAGQIRVFAALGAGGPYDDDTVSLSLDAAARSGVGTYVSAVEGDPIDGTKPRFVYDTRGPDGDPHPDGNSFSDWERDILSGSVTITEIDWDPAHRVLSGTFTFETEFGTNPEEDKDPRTLTGSFHCCAFDLFDAQGAYSPPTR